jgi:predicted nucleotidyltransferase
MQKIYILDKALGQKGKIKILRCLMFASGRLTAREIARRVGLTPWACIKSLRELEKLALVKMEISGRSNMYAVNPNNFIIMKMLFPLFEKEKSFLKSAVDWLVKKVQFKPVSIILFGSHARGEEKIDSDIDFCILVQKPFEVEEAEKEILKIAQTFYQKFGKKLSTHTFDINSFKRKYEKRMALIREIIRDGILLYGKPISEAIK